MEKSTDQPGRAGKTLMGKGLNNGEDRQKAWRGENDRAESPGAPEASKAFIGGRMGAVVKFYVWVIKIALMLGAMGVLKDATLAMAGRAAKAQQGMISYSKFTRMLTAPTERQKAQGR